MPQLLISVTNVEEAKQALPFADIIDLKDPTLGALGALPLTMIQNITQVIQQQKMVSATVGDLPMDAPIIFNAVEKLMGSTTVDFIKIGFFESPDYTAILNGLQPLVTKGAQLIAVLFAEIQYPAELINAIKTAGFVGIMLDTSVKNGRTLFDYYSEQDALKFCETVLQYQLKLGLAGSLNIGHLAQIKSLKPTYVGFRGGVCVDDCRVRELSSSKMESLCKLL